MPEPGRVSLSVAQYRAELLALLAPDQRAERVDLDAALGRVLAADVRSATPNPAFDNSAMDGFAVRAADTVGGNAKLELVGESRAGAPAA